MADLQSSFASVGNASQVIADRTVRNSSGPGSADLNSQASNAAMKSAAQSTVWIVALVAIFAIGALGAGIFFWLHSGSKGAGDTIEKSTLPLETFVVNLEGGGQRAYLRVGITLGLSHPSPRNREDMNVPMVRDAILSVLASAQAGQLLTGEGKEQLKADLLRSITARAPQLGVENVYFTEFLVQM